MEPAETKHLERAARFDLSSEGKHYRMAGLNLLAAIVISAPYRSRPVNC